MTDWDFRLDPPDDSPRRVRDEDGRFFYPLWCATHGEFFSTCADEDCPACEMDLIEAEENAEACAWERVADAVADGGV